MTVKVTKRSVNFLEKLNELDKQSGVAGEAILRSNSFTEASNLVGGRKNLVINGSFDISQRGDFTILTPIVNQEFSVDRFHHVIGNITASVQNSTSNVNNVTCKTLRMQSTSTVGSGYFGIRTNLELGGIVVGQMYTVSCWVKTNRSDVVLRVNDFDASDENSSQIHSGGEKWEHMTMTIPFTGNSPNPFVRIWFGITYANGSSAINDGDYIEIAMPQLEAGPTATAFEHRTYGEELALCQRYYFKLGDDGSVTNLMAGTVETSTGAALLCGPFPTTMRSIPAVALGAGTQFYSPATTTRSASINSNRCGLTSGAIFVNISGGGAVLGQACSLYDTGANGYIEFDAEL